MTARRALFGATLCLLLLVIGLPSTGAQAPRAEVYAVRYGTIKDFPVRSLVAGADRARTLDIAMMVWVLKQPDGKAVLVDAGFYRQKFIDQWKPVEYVRPDVALERAFGIRPADVSDVIVTHVHWDHADGADLFANARVWLQREEYDHHVGPDGSVLARAIDPEDAAMFASLRAAGRAQLIDGDDQEILPGVRVYTGGKHTFASQYVGVSTRAGTVVLASDNAYLFENLEQRLAIAQTLDAASNLAAQTRMLGLSASPRHVVPGHDPAVFTRFAAVGPGVVRID